MKSPLAILVLAIGLAGAAHAATAQQTLKTAMGDKGKDLTVSVTDGVATLQG